MAELNLEYYTDEDRYSDGDVEEVMLRMVQNGESFEDFEDDKVEFPIIYHFARIRQNILNWYPFKEQASILEIGAGCGALTGLLCERAASVTAVELSKRRALINFERHKDFQNLVLMVGNLNDMKFQEKFDYIVLNGVLEYAASFTEGEKPYVRFLKYMKSFLKPDGKLLIAIENRLGLKYFAGAPEDHTDIYYLGLNNYRGNKSVRTFSKCELETLLKNSGLPFMNFYYPYPDYKFPTEIFTDETLKANAYGKSYQNFSDKRIHLFDEDKVAHDLVEEGVADRFSNSFLVEAGMEEEKREEELLYVKINSERREEFQIATSIWRRDGEMFAVKQAITEAAVPFIDRMTANSSLALPEPYENLKCTGKDGILSYPYIHGSTLLEIIRSYVKQRDGEKVLSVLNEFYSRYFSEKEWRSDIYSERFAEVFGTEKGEAGYECIEPANIDLICDNIFLGDQNSYIIDYEWIFDIPVPVNFIMWRMINELYWKLPEIEQVLDRSQIHEFFHITEKDHDVFLAWSKYFAYVYVGSESLSKYAKPELELNLLEAADQQRRKNKLFSKLYYDTGNGLNESECLKKEIKIENNRFQVEYHLSKVSGIRYIRWEITEEPCWIIIDKIDCNRQVGLIPYGDYQEEDDKYIFRQKHSGFIIDTFQPEKIAFLKIEGRVQELTVENVLRLLKKEQKRGPKKEQKREQKKESLQIEAKSFTAAEREPDFKQQMKKMVKHLLHLEGEQPRKAELQYETIPLGNVDVFQYDNQVLQAAGWAYDPNQNIRKSRIGYYHESEQIYSHPYTVIHREDVADAIKCEEAVESGFSVVSRVCTPFELKVFLEYDTDQGKSVFFLGTIPADPSQMEVQIIPCTEKDQIGNIRYFLSNHIIPQQEIPAEVFGYEIDIVIPVYNGYEYFDDLFAGLEQTNMHYRLLIINDKSPDERVWPYLQEYAEHHENVVLMNNEENLGFVGSVNRALDMVHNHVVLLNTDVVVSYQWLERLMIPIICQSKVATTTPFTNCGTLCSFPRIGEDNSLVEDLKLWQMDDAFRRIRPQYPVIPTGVGFCMGMNLEAIREIGLLDADTFGKGYGEENDWCRRAAERGYRNIHVDNLFVYHKHGGSFLSEEKQKLLARNSKALLAKHPDYNQVVASYFQADPLKPVRLYVLLNLLNQLTDVYTIVAFNHNLGGGATEYLIKKKEAELKCGRKFITITYDIGNNRYQVDYQYKSYKMGFFSNKLESILPLLGRTDEIWINELVTYQKLYTVMDTILVWREEQGAYLKMLLHDYFAICPAINLMNADGKYCDVGNEAECQSCIPENRSNACLDYESAKAWRGNWGNFLRSCDEITAFSESSMKLLEKAYPDLGNIKLIPHEPHYVPALNKKAKTTKTLNIGFLGVLCYKKGLDVVKRMAKEIEERNLNIRLKLIGVSDEEIPGKSFRQTGRYRREELPRLVLEEDIDLFFIPAIWPETFSYTTSEIMSMNLPIVVFDIGAPVERVRMYEKGLVLRCDLDEKEILRKIEVFADEVCKVSQMPVHEKKVLFIAEENSFASRYRVEHFREQLRQNGYASDYIQNQESDDIKVSNYRSVVFYRCSDVKRVEKIVKDAKKAEVPVFYDIDDFIFDYDKITYLEFLQDEEYRSFRATTERIKKCMELCQGYLTSTVTLQEEIRKAFPGRPVVVKRNVASMEMQILSHNAEKGRGTGAEKVWIGYFSGSATHNKDFGMVERVLDDIMSRYPNVYLKLGGVIEESVLKKYTGRIEKFSFMEWQRLPEAIASVDINLMPLEDTRFHCCKSENKWMEAALVKVPSVISRNQEMERVIEDQKTGILCSTQQEWTDAIRRLVVNKKLREEIGEAANRIVLEKYTTKESGMEAIQFVIQE